MGVWVCGCVGVWVWVWVWVCVCVGGGPLASTRPVDAVTKRVWYFHTLQTSGEIRRI